VHSLDETHPLLLKQTTNVTGTVGIFDGPPEFSSLAVEQACANGAERLLDKLWRRLTPARSVDARHQYTEVERNSISSFTSLEVHDVDKRTRTAIPGLLAPVKSQRFEQCI
jgi:hypothetical protein